MGSSVSPVKEPSGLALESTTTLSVKKGSSSHAIAKTKMPLWGWVLIIILLLAVIGLSIGLGVVASDECSALPEVGISRRPFVAVDPFEGIEANARTIIEGLWDNLTPEQRYGQIAMLGGGDIDQITRGVVGALGNVHDASAINGLQALAVNATGIPLLLGYDTIHGYKTVFPMNIGMAATFNSDLHYTMGLISAQETRAIGIHWTFGPMLDLARDSRWGRMSESCGESPYMASILGASLTEGLIDGGLLPCVKHFAGYGGAQSGRDYNLVDMSLQSLYNDYLPPYKAAFDVAKRMGKPISAMASFNTINNVPSHANRWLLSELLRGDWGFSGLVVSDFTGIPELLEHSVAASGPEAFAKGVYAGVDLEMAGNFTAKHAAEAVALGFVDEATLYLAAKRVIRTKYDIGLLPVNDSILMTPTDQDLYGWVSPSSLEAAREAARESIVLLKNTATTSGLSLPITLGDNRRIGVVGYMADSVDESVGSWSGTPRRNDTVTLLKGIVSVVGLPSVVYQPGFVRADQSFVGEKNCSDTWAYQPRPPFDWTGETGVGSSCGVTFPCDDTVLHPDAVKLAEDETIDYLVIVMGETHSGDQGMTAESTSRADLDLTRHQKNLLDEIVAKANGKKHITLVLTAGRALSIEDQVADTGINSILYIWALGTQGGNGFADLLFNVGNVAAGGFGRTPVTFPRTVGQCPMYAETMKTGRPPIARKDWGNATGEGDVKFKSRYIDVRQEPLFPFGFGLTYSKFEYTKTSISPESQPAASTGNFTVQCTIRNVGTMEATEVVQLYVEQPHTVGVAVRPRRLLRGFQRLRLGENAEGTANFEVPVQSLGFYNENMKFVVEASQFIFYCSPNSEHRHFSDFADPFAKEETLGGNGNPVTYTPYTLLGGNVTVSLY